MSTVFIWKPQRSHYAYKECQEHSKDHHNQLTDIYTSPNTIQSYTTLISTASQTWETCWSLEIWHSLERNKHVISWGIFSKAELRWAELHNALNQNNSPSSAFLDNTKSTAEAKTDSVAAGSAQSRIVLQQPNQPVSSSEQTHTNRRTQERLGVFIAHLSSYRVICGCRLFKHLASSHCNTRVYIQSQRLNGVLSWNHDFIKQETLHNRRGK